MSRFSRGGGGRNNNPSNNSNSSYNNNRNDLNVNIDGRVKSEIWTKLTEFQKDTNATEYIFTLTFSNQDRKYVHKVVDNLGLYSKSYGSGANRAVHVFKVEPKLYNLKQLMDLKKNGGSEANKSTAISAVTKREKKAQLNKAKLEQFLPISLSTQVKIDKFLAIHPISKIHYFDPLKQHLDVKETENQDNKIEKRSRNSKPKLDKTRLNYQQNPVYLAMIPERAKLPIFKSKEAIIDMISKNQVIVISGSTGCGKSTQVPQFLLEYLDSLSDYTNGFSSGTEIICTQPRRISAMGLAERVSSERGENVGQSVGYQIRLESFKSTSTRILFCTVGILLRRLVTDTVLAGVKYIIVDEIHERDRMTDFLLIVLKQILSTKPHLKLICMSATINADLFSSYFNHCPHLYVPGFTFPVQTFFLEDLIELTNYSPHNSIRSMTASDRSRAKHNKTKQQEKDLQNLLQTVLDSQLFTKEKKEILENKQNQNQNEDTLMEQLNALTVNPDNDNNAKKDKTQAIGWVDTYVYKSVVELDSDNKDQNNEQKMENDLSALMNKIELTDTKSNNSAKNNNNDNRNNKSQDTRNNNSDIKHLKNNNPESNNSNNNVSAARQSQLDEESRYDSSNRLPYSSETLKILKSIEDAGMDYIDYQLIIDTIIYICTRFSHDAVEKLHKTMNTDSINVENGSILVFLPGWEEITKVLDMLSSHPVISRNSSKYLLLPLHGSIPSSAQKAIFIKPKEGQRKIILSTNIAETSITIDDVVFCIDGGKMKEKSYDQYAKMSTLQATWISKANAKQRSGRAGRSRPGICFRLYTRSMYDKFDEFQVPEMLRTPLEELALQIKLLDLGDIQEFLAKSLQPPQEIAVSNAIETLKRLGALNPHNEELTELGEYLATLPLDPKLGKLILYGAVFQCLDPILIIASCLSYRDPFILPMDEEKNACNKIKLNFSMNSQSDLIMFLNVFANFNQLHNVGDQYKFCRENFLSFNSMKMITEMKTQFTTILYDCGFLDNTNSLSVYYNQYSSNIELIKAILTAGFYPNICTVQNQTSSTKKKAKKTSRLALCTRDGLINLHIHPSSVNKRHDILHEIVVSDKSIQLLAANAIMENKPRKKHQRDRSKPHTLLPLIMYNEMSRSNQVYIRDTTAIPPLMLALIVTNGEVSKENQAEMKLQESEPDLHDEDDDVDEDDEYDDYAIDQDKDDKDNNDQEDEDEEEQVDDKTNGLDNDDDEEEMFENEDLNGEDIDIDEEELVEEFSRYNKKKKKETLDKYTHLKPLYIDDSIRYFLQEKDLERLTQIRHYINWLIHKRINKTEIQTRYTAQHDNEENEDVKQNQIKKVENIDENSIETSLMQLLVDILTSEKELYNQLNQIQSHGQEDSSSSDEDFTVKPNQRNRNYSNNNNNNNNNNYHSNNNHRTHQSNFIVANNQSVINNNSREIVAYQYQDNGESRNHSQSSRGNFRGGYSQNHNRNRDQGQQQKPTQNSQRGGSQRGGRGGRGGQSSRPQNNNTNGQTQHGRNHNDNNQDNRYPPSKPFVDAPPANQPQQHQQQQQQQPHYQESNGFVANQTKTSVNVESKEAKAKPKQHTARKQVTNNQNAPTGPNPVSIYDSLGTANPSNNRSNKKQEGTNKSTIATTTNNTNTNNNTNPVIISNQQVDVSQPDNIANDNKSGDNTNPQRKQKHKRAHNKGGKNNDNANPDAIRKCYNCSQYGHISKACPSKQLEKI